MTWTDLGFMIFVAYMRSILDLDVCNVKVNCVFNWLRDLCVSIKLQSSTKSESCLDSVESAFFLTGIRSRVGFSTALKSPTKISCKFGFK